jgi:hypothetical protein
VGGGFAAIGFAPVLLSGGHYHLWPLLISVVLCLTAMAFPTALQPVCTAWMAIGGVLGAINSRIILGLVYFLLFTPFGIIRKLSRRNSLHLEFDKTATTYRVKRNPRDASHMQRQF